MSKKWLILFLIVPALFFWGCPKDDDDKEENNNQTPQEDAASGSVTSTTSGTITTPLGARIVVPAGAVPETQSGDPGTMVFSIERNNDILVTPPTGESVVSDIYQFGPEGFEFAMPVEVAVPIPGDADPGLVSLWRKNPTTGEPEFYGSEYDPATRTVKAQTYHLSPWFISTQSQQNTASGCLHVTNGSLTKWLFVCIEQYNLRFPEQVPWLQDGDVGNGVVFAPIGTIGWASEGNWYVPQGTYRLCYQYESSSNPGTYYHEFQDGVEVLNPWTYNDPRCTNVGHSEILDGDTGRCFCNPAPTHSVGTGDIQVTLTWFNASSLDLDLWVSDPGGSQGEWCYYGNGAAPNTTTSGGQLDLDNKCSNYQNGRPENIYWTRTPPNGEYIVAVDWFYACGNELGAQAINIRTVVRGTTRTFNATIQPDQNMMEVTRFSISGSTVVFLPPRPDVVHVTPKRMAK